MYNRKIYLVVSLLLALAFSYPRLAQAAPDLHNPPPVPAGAVTGVIHKNHWHSGIGINFNGTAGRDYELHRSQNGNPWAKVNEKTTTYTGSHWIHDRRSDNGGHYVVINGDPPPSSGTTPRLEVTGSSTINVNGTVQLNASSSTNPQNRDFVWNFGDGSSQQGSSAYVGHRYTSSGTFSACVQIDGASGQACVNITVNSSGPTPTPTPPQPEQSQCGARVAPRVSTVPGNIKGMNIDHANTSADADVSRLKEADVQWVRIEFNHSKTFNFYRTRIEDYHNNGIQVLMVVTFKSLPGFEEGIGPVGISWDDYLTNFDAKLDQLLCEFGSGNKVDAWEIWNEPDTTKWNVPPAKYAEMLRKAKDNIRTHPRGGKPIVLGGLVTGLGPHYLQNVITHLNGQDLPVDVVGVHPYCRLASSPHPFDLSKTRMQEHEPEVNPLCTDSSSWNFTIAQELQSFRDKMNAAPNVQTKPLWITEIGTPIKNTTDAQILQGDYLAAIYKQAATQQMKVFWFAWSDAMGTTNETRSFGIVDINGGNKCAFFAHKSPWHWPNNAPTNCGGPTVGTIPDLSTSFPSTDVIMPPPSPLIDVANITEDNASSRSSTDAITPRIYVPLVQK